MEDSVLTDVEARLLNGDVLMPALEVALEQLQTDAPARHSLDAERAKLNRELSNLGAAVAAGADVQTVLAEIKKREARKNEVERELSRPAVDRASIRRALETKIANWRVLLHSSPTHGRTTLGRLVRGGSIEVYQNEAGIWWRAGGQPEELLKGLYRCLASPTGLYGMCTPLDAWFPRAA